MLAAKPKADPNMKRSSCQYGHKQGVQAQLLILALETCLIFEQGLTRARVIYNTTHHFGS